MFPALWGRGSVRANRWNCIDLTAIALIASIVYLIDPGWSCGQDCDSHCGNVSNTNVAVGHGSIAISTFQLFTSAVLPGGYTVVRRSEVDYEVIKVQWRSGAALVIYTGWFPALLHSRHATHQRDKYRDMFVDKYEWNRASAYGVRCFREMVIMHLRGDSLTVPLVNRWRYVGGEELPSPVPPGVPVVTRSSCDDDPNIHLVVYGRNRKIVESLWSDIQKMKVSGVLHGK